MPELIQILVIAALVTSLIALGGVAVWRLRERRAVGPVLCVRRGSRIVRWGIALAALALAAVVLSSGHELAPLCVPLALITGRLALVAPVETDRICGELGVRAGWEVLAFDDFAEWRLTGDHLRFRGAGEWSAVEAPRALHERLRPVLEQRCGERESRFKD